MNQYNYIKKLKEKQAVILSQDKEHKKLYAKDALIKPVFLYPDDTAEYILKKLKKEHINACIVVTKDRKFIGEIGDNDIIKLFLQQIKFEPFVKHLNRGYNKGFLTKCAGDLINKHKSLVSEETPINDVIKLIWKEGFEYIPVLNKQDKVVGVITPSSVIKLLKDY